MINRKQQTLHYLAKLTALFLFVFFQTVLLRAQSVSDTGRVADTGSIRVHSIDTTVIRTIVRKPPKAVVDTVVVYHTDSLRYSPTRPVDYSHLPVSVSELLAIHPYFNFSGKGVRISAQKHEPVSYDGIFYLLVLMLFYFAIVKLFFTKYLANLLTLFFRASMRQQQIREQVLQSPFPSLLLNNLFLFSGGLYGAFLLRYYRFGDADRLWIHFIYCAAGLALLYLGKYLILRMVGWISNINRAVETYLFVVFMTNKIIGIFLLPFLVLISFSGPAITVMAITLSIAMICLFYVYRFIAGYSTLHKEIKISVLHFFLYLCAFEIAPLLLIYKVLLTYLEKAY